MRLAAVALAALLAGTGHGLAAEASAEQARQLTDVLHKYLGQPLAGKADHVRAEPQGEALRVTIAMDTLMSPLEPFGLTLDPQTVSFLTEPLPDGTWRVTDMQMTSPGTAHLAGETMSYRFDSVTFAGIYDPALAAFATFDETIGSMNVESERQGGHGTDTYGKQVLRGTGVAAGADAVTIHVSQTSDGFSSHQAVALPDGSADAAPPFELSYAIQSGSAESTIEALKGWALLDGWAYAVAHLQAGAPPVDAGEVKALLSGLLPLFDRLDSSGAMKGVAVATPFGAFGLEDFSGGLTMSGITADASFGTHLRLAGASYPERLLPGWAGPFVPTVAEVGFAISGLNLDAAARRVIDGLDPAQRPIVSNETMAAAAKLAVPEAGATLTLNAVHIEGPILKVSVDGQLTLQAPKPTGTLNVHVDGLDKAMEALHDAAGDPVASQVLGALVIAQTLGRHAEAGGTDFAIDIKAGGAIAVNGQVLVPGSSP